MTEDILSMVSRSLSDHMRKEEDESIEWMTRNNKHECINGSQICFDKEGKLFLGVLMGSTMSITRPRNIVEVNICPLCGCKAKK